MQTPSSSDPDAILTQMRERYLGKKVQDTRSPTGNWLGMTLEAVSRGEAVLSMPVRAEMANPYGGIHGGMMATLCDEAIGWAIISLGLEQHYTTVNLNTDFLYTARVGEVIQARSRIVRQGKKIINAEVQVYNESGLLLAHTTSNLVVTGMKMSATEVFDAGSRT